MSGFKILRQSKVSQARLGLIATSRGSVSTPRFMPDATRGYVKTLNSRDLTAVKAGPLVVNSYHLYLEPGLKIIDRAGGINKFMNWPGPLLSDSGGYQVFSLLHDNPRLGKITDDKVIFKSPLDGRRLELTPEQAIKIQFRLGVQMMVCFDDPPPNHYSKTKIKQAVARTVSWAAGCKREYERQLKKRKISGAERPLLFGVIQGGGFIDLRKDCAAKLLELDFDGYAFGARHRDQSGRLMEAMVKRTAALIPDHKLRFALGVGRPDEIVKFAGWGWDLFDCVIPTREGRHGRLFYRRAGRAGELRRAGFYRAVNIKRAKFKNDFSPLNPVSRLKEIRNCSKAYLRHLFKTGDSLAQRLASLHNLEFYFSLMENIRRDIRSGRL